MMQESNSTEGLVRFGSSAELSHAVLGAGRHPEPKDPGLIKLTPREERTLQLTAEGFNHPQIVEILRREEKLSHLSVRTIETHGVSLRQKMRAKNNEKAVVLAIRYEMVDEDKIFEPLKSREKEWEKQITPEQKQMLETMLSKNVYSNAAIAEELGIDLEDVKAAMSRAVKEAEGLGIRNRTHLIACFAIVQKRKEAAKALKAS